MSSLNARENRVQEYMQGSMIIYLFIDRFVKPLTPNQDASLKMYKVSSKRNDPSICPPEHFQFFHFDGETVFPPF